MAFVSITEKYGILRNIIHLAKADEQINIPEITYITWVASKLEVSKDEVIKLVNEDHRLHNPLSKEEKQKHLLQLIKIVMVDGVVTQEEVEDFRVLLSKMMVKEEVVNNILERMLEGQDEVVTRAELDAIVDA